MKQAMIISALLFLFLTAGTAQAAPEVDATVDRTRVALGESLKLEVSIRDGDGEVDIDPIQGFKIISRGTSSSINIVNTRIMRQKIYTYTLIPLKEGTYEIPSLPVRIDGKTYRTDSIPIQVESRSRQAAAEEDVFVDASISDETPYEGQQIVYTFRLYQRVQVTNARFQSPSFSGFTAEEVSDRLEFTRVINGRTFHITELNYVLVPLTAGEKRIEPATLYCDVIHSGGRRNRGIFNDPFFNPGRTRMNAKVFQTDSFAVQVQPLPPYRGDVAFSGLVGHFNIHSDMDTTEMTAGESVTLSLTVEGQGNIKDAGVPVIPVPDDLKVYADTPAESVELTPEGYTGKKVFRMAIVPVSAGEYTLPPVPLTYFDTDQEQYITRYTQPVTLQVSPPEDAVEMEVFSAPPPGEDSAKRKVEFTGRDILPVREDMSALEHHRPLPQTTFVLLLTGPAFFCLLVWFGKTAGRKPADPASVMAGRARKELKLASGNKVTDNDFFAHLYRALVSAVYARAGTKGESLTCTEAEHLLKKSGTAPETAAEAAALLERIESARFGGADMEPAVRQELMSGTQQLIRRL